jgi:uncharacterized protein with NRDE domain
MCLILFAYKVVPGCPLIVAANRDEWFSRPATPAAFWTDHPDILAGRDLQAGGTWLGISNRGRFAALTNFRNPNDRRLDAPSRGALVSSFLAGTMTAQGFMLDLSRDADAYNGFSMLAGDASGLFCYSNRGDDVIKVQPGIHGLSNHLLDTPWPKVVKGRSGLEALLKQRYQAGDYLDLMDDSVPPEEQVLPKDGAAQDWERSLSSMRIMKGDYGTRCSTALRWCEDGNSEFSERTYHQNGEILGEVHHDFKMNQSSIAFPRG